MACPDPTGPCRRCGECCAAFELGRITAAEAERLGREFCEQYKDGSWSIRRVERPWAPWWALKGICVFYYPGIGCTVYEDRPVMCSVYSCQSDWGGPLMRQAWANLVHQATADGAMTCEFEARQARQLSTLVGSRKLAVRYRSEGHAAYRRCPDGHYFSVEGLRSEYSQAHYMRRWRDKEVSA